MSSLEIRGKSVTADDRAAKPVVDARGDEINVLTDAVSSNKDSGRGREGESLILYEQVVVFDADRPVRGETIFKADADGAAPAGVIQKAASVFAEKTTSCRLFSSFLSTWI